MTNSEDRKFMNKLSNSVARLEERIKNIHEDIIDIKENQKGLQADVAIACNTSSQNEKWIRKHEAIHKEYFSKAIAILGVLTGLLTAGWKILLDALFN